MLLDEVVFASTEERHVAGLELLLLRRLREGEAWLRPRMDKEGDSGKADSSGVGGTAELEASGVAVLLSCFFGFLERRLLLKGDLFASGVL